MALLAKQANLGRPHGQALSLPEDDAGAALRFAPVTATFEHADREIVTVRVRDAAAGSVEELGTTATHPFWLDESGGVLVPLADESRAEQGCGPLYATSADGHVVRATRGWVHAADLKQGYVLRAADGRLLVVEAVRTEQQRRAVYNITVAGTHTYFVGNTATRVHNKRPRAGQSIDSPTSR